jgi:putative endonuclease
VTSNEKSVDKWSVYLVRCGDDSLYAGIALDVERRLQEHREGKRGAKYLRGRGPLELVVSREVGDKGLALKVELRMKKLSRKAKEKLIRKPEIVDELVRACQDDAP